MKKTAGAILCMGMAMSMGLVACKKAPEHKMAYHVFWFDKTTSDSLKANGITRLGVYPPPQYKLEGGDLAPITISADEWYASEPEVPPIGEMKVLRMGLNMSGCSSSRMIEYSVVQAFETYALGEPIARLSHSSGILTFGATDVVMYHRLVWQ